MARVIRMAVEQAEERARVSESQHAIKDYLDARFGIEARNLQKRVEMIMNLDYYICYYETFIELRIVRK